MSSGGYLYLALYRQRSHQYHWAFVVSPWNVLNDPVEIFQITQNGGPWQNGYRERLYLVDSSAFLCCIPISPIQRDYLQGFRTALMVQPVEKDNTPLTPPHTRWSCEQWCLRTLDQLIQGRYVADGFNTRHHKWKELFYMNVTLTANRAETDPRYGSYNGDVRVVPFISN